MHLDPNRQGGGYILSDKLLRGKSFIYADNVKKKLPKFTSHANIPIREGI